MGVLEALDGARISTRSLKPEGLALPIKRATGDHFACDALFYTPSKLGTMRIVLALLTVTLLCPAPAYVSAL